MTEHEKQALQIKAYLYRNVKEFTEARVEIFRTLNIEYDDAIDKLIRELIIKLTPYYSEYLRCQMTTQNLRNQLKREMRLILILLRDKIGLSEILDQDPDREKNIKKEVERWYEYIKNIFIPFEDKDELFILLHSASDLAKKYSLRNEMVFINDSNYNMFLRLTHNNEKKTKKEFDKLLSPFKKDDFPKKAHDAVDAIIDNRLKEIYEPA